MAERRTPLLLIRDLCDRLDGRIQAGSSLAEACQTKPTVDADRSARDTGAADALGPHSQVTLGPTDRRRSSDRHRLLERFENPDRASPKQSNMGFRVRFEVAQPSRNISRAYHTFAIQIRRKSQRSLLAAG